MGKIEDELQSLKEQLAKRDEQLDRALSLLEGRGASMAEVSEDEKVAALVADLEGKTRPSPRQRLIPGLSRRTGATFMFRVVESRGFKEGRIVELVDYKYPEGVDKHVQDGGIVPDGMMMTRADNGKELPLFRQWRYDNFWKSDLNEFIGKPLSVRDVEPADLAAAQWAVPSKSKAAA
jgi:hypothetical protein